MELMALTYELQTSFIYANIFFDSECGGVELMCGLDPENSTEIHRLGSCLIKK